MLTSTYPIDLIGNRKFCSHGLMGTRLLGEFFLLINRLVGEFLSFYGERIINLKLQIAVYYSHQTIYNIYIYIYTNSKRSEKIQLVKSLMIV